MKVTKEDLIKAAQERKKAYENAKLATLILGGALVTFALWGVLFNQSVPAENYAVVLMIGAIIMGIGGIEN